jgi:hypothetical protein
MKLKAKSDNPVTGIDFRWREVDSLMNALILVKEIITRWKEGKGNEEERSEEGSD